MDVVFVFEGNKGILGIIREYEGISGKRACNRVCGAHVRGAARVAGCGLRGVAVAYAGAARPVPRPFPTVRACGIKPLQIWPLRCRISKMWAKKMGGLYKRRPGFMKRGFPNLLPYRL